MLELQEINSFTFCQMKIKDCKCELRKVWKLVKLHFRQGRTVLWSTNCCFAPTPTPPLFVRQQITSAVFEFTLSCRTRTNFALFEIHIYWVEKLYLKHCLFQEKFSFRSFSCPSTRALEDSANR